MARYLKSSLNIRRSCALINFSSHLLLTTSQSYAQTKIKPFYCTKFVIAPIKGIHPVRAVQECTTVLFLRKKKERTITKM